MTYMEDYIDAFVNGFLGMVQWTWRSIVMDVPWQTNYFWGLILISLVVWVLEILFPWRRDQSIFRKDFWLDGFYMFFNFFLFALVLAGVYRLLGLLFFDLGLSIDGLALVDIAPWPQGLQLLVFFVLLDFLQWFTHVMLQRFEALWEFHKVHHSVKEMGFAAHLRFHWMENILYKPLKTLGVMFLGGFEPQQAYLVHFVAIAIGHFNHANLKLTYGPLKYILNNPVMHLHHHAYTLPQGSNGVNYGISLSLWDYLFKTAHVPESSGRVPLGFPGDGEVPQGFFGQFAHGFKRRKK